MFAFLCWPVVLDSPQIIINSVPLNIFVLCFSLGVRFIFVLWHISLAAFLFLNDTATHNWNENSHINLIRHFMIRRGWRAEIAVLGIRMIMTPMANSYLFVCGWPFAACMTRSIDNICVLFLVETGQRMLNGHKTHNVAPDMHLVANG